MLSIRFFISFYLRYINLIKSVYCNGAAEFFYKMQSAKSEPVSSFLSVLIFFPPFGIITAKLCTAAHAVNEWRQTALCLVCFVLIHKQGNSLL